MIHNRNAVWSVNGMSLMNFSHRCARSSSNERFGGSGLAFGLAAMISSALAIISSRGVSGSATCSSSTIAASFPGSFENLADFTAPYPNQMDKSWNLVEGAENTITISNGAFIGFYTGVNTYRILELTDSTMYLQYGHHLGGLNWYLRLKTE